MSSTTKEDNFKIIFALSLVHFIGDFYNAFVIPLLPIFVTNYSLTLAKAGLIANDKIFKPATALLSLAAVISRPSARAACR